MDVMEDIPTHRRPLPETLLINNKYIDDIKQMRENTKDATRPLTGQIRGPIAHALQHVPGFACSASEWTSEHLTRFQIVVFQDQPSSHLFPDEYLITDNDKTMKALKDNKFFSPDENHVSNGEWDYDCLHHFFFTDLMLLLRGGDRTPSPRTSPPQKSMRPRDAKEEAQNEIKRVLESHAQAGSSAVSRTSMDTDSYRPSMSSIRSHSLPDHGPRETLTYSMMHNFLKYLGTIEYKVMKNKIPLWIAS